MPDTPPTTSGYGSFRTQLSHLGRPKRGERGFVNPPVYRGSTVLSVNIADREAHAGRRMDQVLTYGTAGSATHHALEDMVAAIEGGTRCQITSTGLSAVTTPLLAYLSAGDHLLVTDSCYGPTRNFCDEVLTRYGVETTYYRPDIDGDGIAALMRPNTRVLFLESPGTHTFEVQDVSALARAARAHTGRVPVKVLMDNSWGLHFFQPFAHGVDVSIQALTKYAAGHSDVLLGSVTVNSDEDWQIVRGTAGMLGQYASPDDCWLALRGLRTLAVRLERQMESAIAVARWLASRPEVARVLHPALPGAPGHELWKRDFSGASSLFGVVMKPEWRKEAVHAMIDSLALFGIGASWGGFESLILPSFGQFTRTLPQVDAGAQTLRVHVGLEDVGDLIADLERGFGVMREFGG
jgi:cystathionine beta-lyase